MMVYMDITQYVEGLRRDLGHAAEAGGEDIRAAAERLALALDPAVRLTLMDALSQAACDITNELEGSSVEVRLRGREPVFVVMGDAAIGATPADSSGSHDTGVDDTAPDDDGAVARITLRLPESLKNRAEDLANSRGQSLNTWLVSAARHALSISLDVASSPIGSGGPGRNRSSNKRIQGWVR